MNKWYTLIPNRPIVSLMVWLLLCILPFYFIFYNQPMEIFSVAMAVLITYIICVYMHYRMNNGLAYMWLTFEMLINGTMSVLFGYFYFALFTAFFIGRLKHKVGFFIMYGFHIAISIGSIIGGFFIQTELYIKELPLMVIIVFGIILAPFYLFSRKQNDKLAGQLQTARERISELRVVEERQRIARDLHDTLGQKLSMIGLKLDLAIRLVDKNPEKAKIELAEIRKTSSMALKEVREMVSDMKKIKLQDELIRVEQILEAANIQYKFIGNAQFTDIPLLLENTLSMCLKEAVNNVVKHSEAAVCTITVEQNHKALKLIVHDNGKGFTEDVQLSNGNGLKGIYERVQFINGELIIDHTNGTTIKIIVPFVIVYSDVE